MFWLIPLLLSQAPQHRLFEQPNLRRPNGQAAPFFSFAPIGGAGMTAACACTTPTGANGEVLTFARASSGTCLKGPTVTGIANGDMVTCTTNQPRVMPGGDGTGGVGLLVEATRTNSALRSQEFDNAAVWVPSHSGGADPVVTADAAVAPDGTTTAERIQLGARSSGWSLLQQAGVAAGTKATSVYVMGNGQGGSFQMTVDNAACVTCTYVAGSWSRCLDEGVTGTVLSFGIDITSCGAASFPSQDFFLWGGESELGAYATSYIATTSIAVARAGELADVAVTFGAGTTGFSMAGTAVLNGLPSNPVVLGCIGDRAPGVAAGSITYACPDSLSAVFRGDTTASSTNVYSTGLAVTTASRRFVELFTTGGVHNGCVDGPCGAGDTGKTWTAPAWLRWRLGNYDINHNNSDGVLKNLCLDPASGACR
jgi:hypothetical protein